MESWANSYFSAFQFVEIQELASGSLILTAECRTSWRLFSLNVKFIFDL